VAQEVELKLELDRGWTEALEEQAFFGNAEAQPQRQVSIYYDTSGGKLRKHGLTLRCARRRTASSRRSKR
jgi:inorganic triphosphatase YgiF